MKPIYFIQSVLAIFPYYKLKEGLAAETGVRIFRVQENNIVVGYWGLNSINPEKGSWEVLFAMPCEEGRLPHMLEALLDWGQKNNLCCLAWPVEEPGKELDHFLSDSGFSPLFAYTLYGKEPGSSLVSAPRLSIRKRNNLDYQFLYYLHQTALPHPLQRLYLREELTFQKSPLEDLASVGRFLPKEVMMNEWVIPGYCYTVEYRAKGRRRISLLYDHHKNGLKASLDTLISRMNPDDDECLTIEVPPQDGALIDELSQRGLKMVGEKRIWARYSFVEVKEEAPLLGTVRLLGQ